MSSDQISELLRHRAVVVTELKKILEMQKHHPELETHPGGIKLGLSDNLIEEVMILVEIQEILGPEEWATFIKEEYEACRKATKSDVEKT
jgi:hypothetical protein